MAKYTIHCVGLDIPDDAFEYVSFHSGSSLLDADIILFEPQIDYRFDRSVSSYHGKTCLSDSSSIQNRDSLKHWRHELSDAFMHGATIFIFLEKPEEVYASTGSEEYSGTGKGRQTIRHVAEIESYSVLPVEFKTIIPSRGRQIKLTQQGSNMLGAYWKALGSICHYEVYYNQPKGVPLMETKKGERTVASWIKGEKGNILLLPVLDFSREEFDHYDEKKREHSWTDEACQYGKALLGSVVELHRTLKTGGERSPAPSWVTSKSYKLQIEKTIDKEIAGINKKITEFREKRLDLEKQIEQETITKGLLYEKGTALEAAIIEALLVVGFKAEGYQDEESEFDIIFESDEGRFLGEAEGKDTSAINIEKIRQLESNIQEDYAKDHVTEYAKGVLFGNPHRLTEPGKRTTLFTAKAISSAKRSGYALVHTADLFPIVQYLKNSKDESFAREVRQCFADTSGEIVKFPAIPVKAKQKSTKPKSSPNINKG
jgi:hypothetical protein